jgi:hypothetical protein
LFATRAQITHRDRQFKSHDSTQGHKGTRI